MRRYLDNGTYVLSKVQRTAVFDGETGIDYPNGSVIVYITFDELKQLHNEAKKRLMSINKSRRSRDKKTKVSNALFAHLDRKLALFVHEGTLPRLKPEKNKLSGIKLHEDLGEVRRKCLKKSKKKKRIRVTLKKKTKSKNIK